MMAGWPCLMRSALWILALLQFSNYKQETKQVMIQDRACQLNPPKKMKQSTVPLYTYLSTPRLMKTKQGTVPLDTRLSTPHLMANFEKEGCHVGDARSDAIVDEDLPTLPSQLISAFRHTTAHAEEPHAL